MKREIIPMEELVPLIKMQLQHGGRASLVVTGNSMAPMLHHRRDGVVLQPAPEQLSKGDLIFYRRENGRYILHRIVRCLKDGDYICCGDNQWEKETVTQEQILARVSSFVRKGKTYAVTHRGYGLYVWLWVGLFPIRRPVLAVRRFLGKLCRTLKKCKIGGNAY